MVHFGNRNTRNHVNTKFQIYFRIFIFLDGMHPKTQMQFLTWILRCHLPVETVDVEVWIKSMQGTHMFRRDRMCQIIKCNPWSTRLHPHPTLIKKMRTYLELEWKLGPKFQPQPNHSRSTQPNTNPLIRKETKVTDRRRKLIPKTSNTTAQSPTTAPSASMNS